MPGNFSRSTRSGFPTYGVDLNERSGFGCDSTGWMTILDATGAEEPVLANLDTGRIAFTRTRTITSAAAAVPINVIAESEVPAGKKVYVTGVIGRVNGATVWATTATVKLQDTNGTPVDFMTFAVAALTANARVFPGTANVTTEDAMANGTGGTAAKGLQLVGNANGTGSDLILTVTGFIGA